MARGHRRPMTAPRKPPELPYAHLLGPHTGALEPQGDYDAALFEGLTFDDAEAASARFDQCAFSSVSFTGGGLRGSKFSDVWLRAVRVVGTNLAETQWRAAQGLSPPVPGGGGFSTPWRPAGFPGCTTHSVHFPAAPFPPAA